MTSSISKRHQARNERALQDLIKTVPGNDRCADCQARNPGMCLTSEGAQAMKSNKSYTGWASWSVSTLNGLTKICYGRIIDLLTDLGGKSSWEFSSACDALHFIASLAPISQKSSL